MPETATISVSIPAGLAATLSAIADKRGLPIDADELREAVDLFEAGRRAHHGIDDPGDQTGLLPRAVPCGELLLHTPTIAARLKFRELDDWPLPHGTTEDQAEYLALLTAYILDRARSIPDLELITAATAPGIIAGLRPRMACTVPEIRAAIGEVTRGLYPVLDAVDRAEADAKPPAQIDWATVLLALLTEGGGTLSQWLIEAEPAVWHILGAVRRRNDRERAAADPKAPPGQHDPRVKASAAWHAFEQRLRHRQNGIPKGQDPLAAGGNPPSSPSAPVTAPPAPVTAPGRSRPAPVTAPGRSRPAPVTAPGRSRPAPVTAPVTAPPAPVTAPGRSRPAPPAPVTAPPAPVTAPGRSPPAPVTAPPAPVTAPGRSRPAPPKEPPSA